MLPYEELIRTEDYWLDVLENFSINCQINSKLKTNKDIKELVKKIMESQKPFEKATQTKLEL